MEVAGSSSPDVCDVKNNDSGEDLDDNKINRYMKKPLLCQEATNGRIPRSLRDEYKSCVVENHHDAVVVILRVLMMEKDFKTCTPFTGVMSNGGVCTLEYTHASCPEFLCKVVCVSIASNLMIHGIVLDGEHSCVEVNADIPCDKYVLSATNYRDTDPVTVYNDLASLSCHIKDAIVIPLWMKAQSKMGILTGLSTLPTEVKLQLLRILDVKSLVRMSSVCSELYQLAKEPTLWMALYYRDCKSKLNGPALRSALSIQSENVDWKQKYKEMYRKTSGWTCPSFVRRNDYFGHVPPYPFVRAPESLPYLVFRGGDYDRFPHLPGVPVNLPPFFHGNDDMPLVFPPLAPVEILRHHRHQRPQNMPERGFGNPLNIITRF